LKIAGIPAIEAKQRLGVAILQDSEGRYFLNDLHRAAGGHKKDRPSTWLQN
jgi:hypothetical protein